MAYTENIYISDNYIDHEIYYAGNYGAKGEKRAEREKPTPLQIQKQNYWNRIKYIKRVMQLNFYPDDLWITLKYKKGTRKDITEFKKDISRFFKKLRYQYQKEDKQLLFMYRLEIGKRGGLHAHVLVNRISDADIKVSECWKKAAVEAVRPNFTSIDEYGGYVGLAEYIAKEPDEEIEGQLTFLDPEDRKKLLAVSSSRNLKRPEPIRKRYHHWTLRKIMTGESDIKPTKDFYIDKDTIKTGINKFTGMSYLCYTEIRTKLRKRGQDGNIHG